LSFSVPCRYAQTVCPSPSPTLFRSLSTELEPRRRARHAGAPERAHRVGAARARARDGGAPVTRRRARGTSLVELLVGTALALVRSEEHTSELQSRFDLVCRLLLAKK